MTVRERQARLLADAREAGSRDRLFEGRLLDLSLGRPAEAGAAAPPA